MEPAVSPVPQPLPFFVAPSAFYPGAAPGGLSGEEVAACKAVLAAMAEKEALIAAESNARNQLEALIFEYRSALRGAHGSLLDSAATNADVDAAEAWVWDFGDVNGSAERVQAYNERAAALTASVRGHSAAYFAAVEAARLAVEASLDASAKAADAEREAEGTDDHDDRKLKKGDRLRLVVKNKDEGNELFKGGNYQHAVQRYTKALGHTGKFFDLDDEGKAEVEALKLSLFLNLAQCYIKLELWPKAVGNCDSALKIEEKNVKALYRRAFALVQLKDFDKAEADLKVIGELGAEDAACVKLRQRVEAVKAKQKEREKDMAKRMFG